MHRGCYCPGSAQRTHPSRQGGTFARLDKPLGLWPSRLWLGNVRPKKKRALILFEILIALTLTAILLTFLFSFFVESAKIEKKLDTARMAISNRGQLQTRLQSIFTTIDRGAGEPYFYTKQFEREKSSSLIAIFDNGIDPDPAYSGSITGRIFIDEEKNLCLATWPLDKSKNLPWRKEILLPQVESYEFEFLGALSASEHGKKEKVRSISPTVGWRSAWPESLTSVPTIIRMKIKQEKMEEPLYFAFILPAPASHVTYMEKAS